MLSARTIDKDLDGLSLDIQEGEFLAVIGKNSSKSTFASSQCSIYSGLRYRNRRRP